MKKFKTITTSIKLIILFLLLGVNIYDVHAGTYKAHVTGVYDGDTITADINVGLNIVLIGEKLRLYGIDAPEVRGKSRPKGLKSRDWLRRLILNRDIYIKTLPDDKKGKYGRYIVTVYYKNVNVNEAMVKVGFAVYRNYGYIKKIKK